MVVKLSVIVCTRNREDSIVGCLDSIVASIISASTVSAEIIVVDNASDDGTIPAVTSWSELCFFPTRILRESKKGASAARNCGLRAAVGEIIAFTDDDCRLSKEYVRDLLRHDASDSEAVLRGGRIELGDPLDLPLTIKTDPTARRWNRQMKSAKYDRLSGSISSCNMVMRRELYERLGPFDERFGPGAPIPAAEDADYIFRAYLAGVTIEYVPDMAVSHYHGRRQKSEGIRLLRGYMIGAGALYAKYIFKDANLYRPFYWDLKNALKDAISGENTCVPEMKFTYGNQVFYCLIGAIRYFQVVTGMIK